MLLFVAFRAEHMRCTSTEKRRVFTRWFKNSLMSEDWREEMAQFAEANEADIMSDVASQEGSAESDTSESSSDDEQDIGELLHRPPSSPPAGDLSS